ncbi:MAG: TIGR00730 family Rossman fold protein [Candidatus Eisenbacteria bacterium]|nr:TIGR00730 family Rossman fold protein [Candidatus Eisenbacteria bacterium]
MSEQTFSWEEAEARANHLLDLVGEVKNREFHYEVLMSGVRLAKDDPDRLDLKILNSAFKELRYSFRLFQRHRGKRKVACFGSARTRPGTELYELAERTGEELVQAGYQVITGAGPGVMEAANKGAGLEGGFGLAIRLPFEPAPNRHVRADRLINFKYFFTRKLIFIKESDAFILFPGGFGTNDECFELLTLLQTGKCDPTPVVLLDEPGGTYWESWMQFVRKELVGREMIDDEDLKLLTLAKTPEEALTEIRQFYRVYHSSRFVGDRLMLRLQKPLGAEDFARLERDFDDLIADGTLEACAILEEDAADPLVAGLSPIWFQFDKKRFSRLREMIDTINTL